MKKIILLFFVALISAGVLSAQGYEIKVKIKHIPNQEVILGHHFNERLIPDDTVKLDANCSGVFKGKKALPGGMYFLFLPNKNYFDLMIDKEQKFSVENDTTDFLKNMVISGSVENQVFVDYQKFMGEIQRKFQDLRAQREKEKDGTAKAKELEEKMHDIQKSVEARYFDQIKQYPNMFFSKFLTATRDVEVPETITDQSQRYFYYKAHFFDNFDISDGRLLRTALYQPKIERYIDNMVMQVPDSLIKETNMLVNKARTSDELFRFMLVFLFNKYAKSDNMVAENVYCSLADIYAKDAFWDTDSFKTKLKEKVARKKNCLVGNVSKDILMKQLPNKKEAIEAIRPALETLKEKGVAVEKQKPDFEARRQDVVKLIDDFIKAFGPNYVSVHKTYAKYKLIAFWEPDCSHCKEEMPKLLDFYRDTLISTGCNVFAIYMNKSVDNLGDLHRHCNKWFDFAEEKGFLNVPGWYNLMNPFDQYRVNFDINSTPTFYLLNEKNEIIAKRISYHQSYELIKLIEGDRSNGYNDEEAVPEDEEPAYED